jgi:hypothetical protein
MKKIIILTLFFYGLLTGTLMAGTYKVNNNLVDNPSEKIFSNLQKAHNAASNGDTLVIEGSYKFYDTLICTKKLFIMGPGYFLNENPGRSINKLSAKVLCIYFNSGSEGTMVTSLEIPLGSYINTNNITIRRCRTYHTEIADSIKNATITGCYFNDNDEYNSYNFGFPVQRYNYDGQNPSLRLGMHITNLLVNNCIILGTRYKEGYYGENNPTIMFMNNIFKGGYALDISIGWKNNIVENAPGFYVRYPWGPDVCCNSIGFRQNDTSLFIDSQSPDGKWQLREGSPAIGAGENGVDCGPFGGPHPYVLSGIEKDAGLVAYYKLNGNCEDASGNGNNGIAYRNPFFTKDRFGFSDSACFFTYNYHIFSYFKIGINKFPSGNQPRTISLWFQVPEVSYDTSALFSLFDYGTTMYECDTCNGESFGIFARSEDIDNYVFCFHDGGFKLEASHPMKLNTWHHVVITYRSSDLSMYVDGQLDKKVAHPLNTILKDAFIGHWPYARDGIGNVDDIRLFDRVLSENEIMALYNEKMISVTVNTKSTGKIGRTIEIPIYTSYLMPADNIIAYQFEMDYDTAKFEYIGNSLETTIANAGAIDINNGINGKLYAGYISSTPLIGEGPIINLLFKPIRQGSSTLTIAHFIYNKDAITHTTNGEVDASYFYSDVDTDDKILAYDAALTLQYSVGLDPLPSIDPLPWEAWRIETADVDGVHGITAYDAALILQKSIRLITQFPVENTEKSTQKNTQTNDADVDLKVENNNIVFYSKGSLFGLNVNADNSNNILGPPVLLDSTMIIDFNNLNGNYAIGVATAYSPAENTAFMKIPYSKNGSITFNMIINSESKSVTVDIQTGIVEFSISNITVYPNPAKDNLTVSGIVKPTVANIYSLDGQLLQTIMLYNPTNDISLNNMPNGIYIIKLQSDIEIAVKRFVKQ